MKIDYYPYLLNSIENGYSRKGALLRMDFQDDTIGYADCHPWTELGDASIEDQLKLLAQDKTTSLTERSIHFARLDAMARAQKISLFQDLTIPKCHFLIRSLSHLNHKEIDAAIKKGFTHFKIKLGKEIQKNIDALKQLASWIDQTSTKIRVDFNLQLDKNSFKDFLERSTEVEDLIDFIEDPFNFNAADWAEFQNDFNIELAADYRSHQALGLPQSANVLVIKPAIQDEAIFLSSLKGEQRLVVTSYLDHPLGQTAAAYTAAICFSKEPQRVDIGGFLTQHVYQENEFSKQIKMKDAFFIPPSGTGFGFDKLLGKLEWKPLL